VYCVASVCVLTILRSIWLRGLPEWHPAPAQFFTMLLLSSSDGSLSCFGSSKARRDVERQNFETISVHFASTYSLAF